jgi:phage terminase Nu1 subunit (DNA packaging protein)
MDTASDGVPATFTAVQLRWLLGLSNSRLEQLTTAGVITRIEKGSYTANSVRRYVEFLRTAQEGPRDWQAVRTAIAREKLAMARLDRLEREGKLIEADEIAVMNTTIARTIQARLLAVPAATASRLVGLPSAGATEAVTRPAIEDALLEL